MNADKAITVQLDELFAQNMRRRCREQAIEINKLSAENEVLRAQYDWALRIDQVLRTELDSLQNHHNNCRRVFDTKNEELRAEIMRCHTALGAIEGALHAFNQGE